MKYIIAAAAALAASAALPAAQAGETGSNEAGISNADVFAWALADRVDCTSEITIAEQVRAELPAAETLDLATSEMMFQILSTGEGVCGSLSQYSTDLVVLASHDPFAFEAAIGLIKMPHGSWMKRTGTRKRRGAHVESLPDFDLLFQNSAPPKSSGLKTNSGYGN